jgi:hypothetical protein
MVPAFVTAATKLNTHLKQQQPQRQDQQLALAALASALLHVWNCIGNPYSSEWVVAVLPSPLLLSWH